MSMPRTLVAGLLTGLTLLVGATMQLRADPVLEVIDVRPILARYPLANALGLAFDPDADVFYVAHGSDADVGFIYTLDAHGALLREVDLHAYRPGAFPLSLSYDRGSGHLFVVAVLPEGGSFASRLLEIDPRTFDILGDAPFATDGEGIHVRDDGIWQARFSEDVVRHYTRDGAFVEDLSLAGSFPGFPGPQALTSSFAGGFFVVDLFGRRIVEIDIAGRELDSVSTADLGDGRGLAIDSDIDGGRIFLLVNNQEIYVLSSEFIGGAEVPETVSIDIWPGRSPNRVVPRSRGKIPIAILTTDTFDAATVDPNTVLFGRTGSEAVPVHVVAADIDRDGDTDTILLFRTRETGIRCGDSSASLTGETFSGGAIEGSDAIETVGCKRPPKDACPPRR